MVRNFNWRRRVPGQYLHKLILYMILQTSIHSVGIDEIMTVQGTHLQLRSADQTLTILKRSHLSCHLRFQECGTIPFLISALHSYLRSHLRLWFGVGIEGHLLLSMVTRCIHLFVSKHVKGFFILDGLLSAQRCVISMEMMEGRLHPIGVISTDLSISSYSYAGCTIYSFRYFTISWSSTFRCQFDIFAVRWAYCRKEDF